MLRRAPAMVVALALLALAGCAPSSRQTITACTVLSVPTVEQVAGAPWIAEPATVLTRDSNGLPQTCAVALRQPNASHWTLLVTLLGPGHGLCSGRSAQPATVAGQSGCWIPSTRTLVVEVPGHQLALAGLGSNLTAPGEPGLALYAQAALPRFGLTSATASPTPRPSPGAKSSPPSPGARTGSSPAKSAARSHPGMRSPSASATG